MKKVEQQLKEDIDKVFGKPNFLEHMKEIREYYYKHYGIKPPYQIINKKNEQK